MAEVGGVGGGGGGGSTAGASAGKSADGPSGAGASQDSGAAAKSADASPGGGASQSTIDRAESAQVSDTGAAPSHEALGSLDAADSDPESARDVAATQADVAAAVTGSESAEVDSAAVEGGPEVAGAEEAAAAEEAATAEEAAAVEAAAAVAEEQAARMEEYNAAKATLDRAMTEVVSPYEVEMAREVMLGYADEISSAIGNLESTFGPLDTAVARQTDFLANEAQMLTAEEQARAQEATAAEVAKAQEPFDAATQAMIDTIADPVVQAFVADLPAEDQKALLDKMASYMPASEVGRQWSADFTAGLAELGATGATAHGMAEIAAGVRGALSNPDDVRAFDASMGALVGTGLAHNPEEADARLQAAATALGLPAEEVAALANPAATPFDEKGVFTQTAASAFAAFDAFRAVQSSGDFISDTATNLTYADMGLAGLTAATRTGVSGLAALSKMAADSPRVGALLGATQNGLAKLSGTLSGAGRALGVVSLGFSVAATVDAIRQGNTVGAVSNSLGVAGGVAGIAGSIIGSGGLALAGYALAGAGLALPAVAGHLEAQGFVENALAAALGQEESSFSLRGRMIGTAPPGGAAMLDALRPPDMTIAEYLNSRISMINPEASEFAAQAWNDILSDFAALEQSRLEAQAASR